jgi:predicted nucleic acid-binding Zn ribbon protein
MNRFDLSDNFIDDPEALIRRTRAKLKKVRAATTTSSSTS